MDEQQRQDDRDERHGESIAHHQESGEWNRESRLLRVELAATREVLTTFIAGMQTWKETRCEDHHSAITRILARERERDAELNKLLGKVMAWSVAASVFASFVLARIYQLVAG